MSIRKLDKKDVFDLLKFRERMSWQIDNSVNEIIKSGTVNGNLIENLKKELNQLEKMLQDEKPYINGEYNQNYGNDRICKCGHTYIRHFDPYSYMDPVGCKYCGCYEFEETKENNIETQKD